MTVIDKKPVPLYEVECFECKSKIRYKKSEVTNCFIKCPVCGISIMVTVLNPVELESDEESETNQSSIVRCKDCRHRDLEDHKCDSGALERAGCIFPVDDDYFCAYGET